MKVNVGILDPKHVSAVILVVTSRHPGREIPATNGPFRSTRGNTPKKQVILSAKSGKKVTGIQGGLEGSSHLVSG